VLLLTPSGLMSGHWKWSVVIFVLRAKSVVGVRVVSPCKDQINCVLVHTTRFTRSLQVDTNTHTDNQHCP
jgi:hypothetical protein